jgi:cytochrome c554/c'-like protein
MQPCKRLLATGLLASLLLGAQSDLERKCSRCHREIAGNQQRSHHSQSLRRMSDLPQLQSGAPLTFLDERSGTKYSLTNQQLTASLHAQSATLTLLWAFGAGTKGITFVGRAANGDYGQTRVSYYRRISSIELTTGTKRQVMDAHDALADWLSPAERVRCFGCHTTGQADAPPEEITADSAGIHCVKCHGPVEMHLQAVSIGDTDSRIRNPGKFAVAEQIRFCGTCHRAPSSDFGLASVQKVISDRRTVRYPPQRLVLSRCYDESGKLTCTTCHDPHRDLEHSAAHYDRKCKSCHAGMGANGACPVAKADCVKCHMPREELMKYSSFPDHWIRIVRR